jgi:hypothetical protein
MSCAANPLPSAGFNAFGWVSVRPIPYLVRAARRFGRELFHVQRLGTLGLAGRIEGDLFDPRFRLAQ